MAVVVLLGGGEGAAQVTFLLPEPRSIILLRHIHSLFETRLWLVKSAGIGLCEADCEDAMQSNTRPKIKMTSPKVP